MDFPTFKKAFSSLGEVSSVTGNASYHSIRVSGNNLILTRRNTGSTETILLTELFHVYQNLSVINTTILRDYITGRVYSPSYAVLIAAGFYDSRGNRINNPQINIQDGIQPIAKDLIVVPGADSQNNQPVEKENDEARFFRILSRVLGKEFIQSKGIEKPVDTDLVILPCDFRNLSFEPRMQLLLKEIVEALETNYEFGNISLAHHIDGLIIDHPTIGTRIVEFDEEQHFTPPRRITLHLLNNQLDSPYIPEFLKICNDVAYLNSQVFPKHRISSGMRSIPGKITEFKAWMDQNAKSSGYVEAKNGFNYHGGRISQRAYYDTLRDVAHLAKENDHLNPPLRFAKKTFENDLHRSFKSISDQALEESIRGMLWKFYDIKA